MEPRETAAVNPHAAGLSTAPPRGKSAPHPLPACDGTDSHMTKGGGILYSYNFSSSGLDTLKLDGNSYMDIKRRQKSR